MIRFEKWEGLGNDFIVTEREVTPAEARWLCDRHRGVGADGVLMVGERDGAPSMVILNADGSRPEMCGNGLRCVAGWLAERGARASFVVRTDAGDKRCELTRGSEGRYDVRVDMGRAVITGEVRFGERSFALVDVGNPHAVCFEAMDGAEGRELAPALSRHVAGGVNVELCTVRSARELGVVVFERGVGWTDACGTGACAAVVAAVARDPSLADVEVDVHLPGGVLAVRAAETVLMRGPAGRVFAGEVVLPAAAVALLE